MTPPCVCQRSLICAAGLAPVVGIVAADLADVGDDVGDLAFRIDGGQAGVEDLVDVGLDERRGDHRGEELRGLGRFAVDGDVGVVEAEAGGGLRHRGRHQAERFADELAGDVELGPGVEARRCRSTAARGRGP